MSVSFKLFMTILLAVFVVSPVLAKEKVPVLDRSDMDLTIKPGDDFFRYANGSWLKKVSIPDDKVRYNSFNIVREATDKKVRALLEATGKLKNAAKGTAAQKIRDFYNTGMDEKKIEKQGLTTLKAEFERIEKMKTIGDFQNLVAHFHTYGMGPLFGGTVFQDLKDNKAYRFYLVQSGIGLTDVEYYSKEDDRSKEIRLEYVKHLAKMFELMGDKPEIAASNAKTVMKIETRLAKSSKTRLEMRNIPTLYNLRTQKQIQAVTPNFDWARYLKNISDKDFGDLVVTAPKFFVEVNALLKEVPVKDWKTYLRWSLINNYANCLSSKFVNQNYKFYSEFLSGSKIIRPRWKRITGATNGSLGDLVGQLYVKKHFPPEAKKRMVKLVANLKKAMKVRLEKLKWMGPETKKAALEKLATMKSKIGYPDKWRDYTKLEIKDDSYVQNTIRAGKFFFQRSLNDFGTPVDPDRWPFSPQTVNAGYTPTRNDVCFPAGILQPPFFYVDGDDAVNYGAIGMGIGHEITHGFDDQGRNFNKDGNMINWWQKEDDKKFKALTQKLIDQYSGFTAVGKVKVNGKLSLGENIADYGGLTVSLEAYKLSLKGKDTPKDIEGFDHMQRFFLSYAKLWRGKIRDKALIKMVTEDVHPWGEFRVNGALFNIPEFYKVFKIKKADKLYRTDEQRPVIW